MPELSAETQEILTWLIGGSILSFLAFPLAYFGVLIADKIRESTGAYRS